MDWLSFVAKFLEHMAWPVVAVVLVALLRKEIRILVPFLKRIKAGPLEADFDRDLRELKAQTPDSAKTIAPPAQAASKELLVQLAELHPRSAILEAWVRVEAAARTALGRKGLAGKDGYLSAARLPERLAEQGMLQQGQVTLFHELRRLRNDIAHMQALEPSQEAVRNYIEMASYLQRRLEEPLQ
jgi:hypothetical protein